MNRQVGGEHTACILERFRPGPTTLTSNVESVRAPESIVCVDCGGTCRPLPHPDEEFEPGDSVPYRCVDCWDRWDIVMVESEHDPE